MEHLDIIIILNALIIIEPIDFRKNNSLRAKILEIPLSMKNQNGIIINALTLK